MNVRAAWAGPNQHYRFGRLDPIPTKPRLRAARFAAAAPPPPATADWYSGVPSLPMYGNDTAGDCTCAEVGHQIGTASFLASHDEALFTDEQVLGVYSALSGYDPASGANDTGCVIQDVLGYWRRHGFAGHKCLAFAEVNVADRTEVMQALAAFGSLDLGHAVYEGDMQSLDAGGAWSTVYSRGQLLGGHSTELVGYDQTGGWLVTWGRVQRFTWEWWNARMQEAWLVVLPEWLNTVGEHSPSGFDLHGLGGEMAALTGDPNPFPAPGPPKYPPDAADTALNAVFGPWLVAMERTRPDLAKLQRAGNAWRVAKGFAP